MTPLTSILEEKQWALEIVQQGYALEFERDPTPPSGIRETHSHGPESFTDKTRHRACPPGEQTSRVLLITISCSKKGRFSPTSIELEATPRINSSPTFQDGNTAIVNRFMNPEDWLASIKRTSKKGPHTNTFKPSQIQNTSILLRAYRRAPRITHRTPMLIISGASHIMVCSTY